HSPLSGTERNNRQKRPQKPKLTTPQISKLADAGGAQGRETNRIVAGTVGSSHPHGDPRLLRHPWPANKKPRIVLTGNESDLIGQMGSLDHISSIRTTEGVNLFPGAKTGKPPELVIIAAHPADTDDLRYLKLLRSAPATRHIPAVVLSG